MSSQKVRVKVKGYDHRLVDLSVRQIVEAVERTGGVIVGPVPLPTSIEKFCVIRSPFLSVDRR